MLRYKVHLLAILATIVLMATETAVFAGSFRIVQISDAHIQSTGEHVQHLQSIVSEINALPTKPDLVLSTGDYTNIGAPIEYEMYRDLLSKLTMPVYHAIGNHEVKWSSWGKAGNEQFLHQKLYYSFNHKGIHFIAIDSTVWLSHNSFIDPQQLKWLAEDLKKTGKSMPVVLFYHHCPNYIMNGPAFLNLLRPYNVKLALVGHEHTWGRYVRNGISFQLDEAAYDGDGYYRILDFSDTEIKSYKKEVGKAPVADGVIKLNSVKNPMHLISPRRNSHKNGAFDVIVESATPMQKMEIAIDGRYQNTSKLDDGRYTSNFNADIIPGRHIITARGTDSTGSEWLQSVPITTGDTGREIWRFMAQGAIQRSVTVKDGQVFLGCSGGNVYCLDASSGRQRWKTNAGADVISQIAVDNGVALLGVTDGSFIAISAQTGKLIWSTKLGSPIQSSPAVQNGIIYTGGGNDSFYAIDAATGKVLWSTATGGMIQATPLIRDDKVFFGNWYYNFFCLDAKTGKPVWKREIGQWLGLSPGSSNPSAYGESLFFATFPYPANAPDLFCVDMKTGKDIWTYQTAGEENGCGECSPIVKGDSVFVNTANGNLIRLSAADGKEIWRSKIGQSSSTSSPIAADGKIFTCGTSGLLRSFDENTGKSIWAYSTGNGYIYGSPTYWNGSILVPSLDRSLTCIRDDMPGSSGRE